MSEVDPRDEMVTLLTPTALFKLFLTCHYKYDKLPMQTILILSHSFAWLIL